MHFADLFWYQHLFFLAGVVMLIVGFLSLPITGVVGLIGFLSLGLSAPYWVHQTMYPSIWVLTIFGGLLSVFSVCRLVSFSEL